MRKNHLYLIKALALVLLIPGCRTDEIDIATDEIDMADEEIPSGADTSTTELVDPALAWSESACTAYLGSDSNNYPTLTNEYGVSVTYSSSDTSVATISSSGAVTLVAEGTTTIAASFEQDDTYEDGFASYTLTVSRSASGLAWSAEQASILIGEPYTLPTLSNPHGLSITYTSSDETVALFENATQYNLSIISNGSITITATSEETEEFEAGSVSYTLNITKNTDGISWSEGNATVTIGAQDNVYPTLNNPGGQKITYLSSNTGVVTIADDGTVTLVSAGETTISATSEAKETDEVSYEALTVSYVLTVQAEGINLVSPGFSWPASAYTATMGSAFTSPMLTNPNGVSVTYTSSNVDVATITSNGTVTILAAGSTTITATSEATDQYKSVSASYTLTVISSADDGAVTTSFASAGSSDDDDISQTTFTRLVTVTYSGTSASVSGYSAVADAMDVSVSGAGVTITYTGSENVAYKLTGTASNGYFKLYSSKKQALWLSGVSITNSSGAAINNQSGKRTFVYVDGSCALSDGSSAGYSTTGDEDMKGVFFSEGQLIFSGPSSGTNKLSVTAGNVQSKSGIVSDDYIRMLRNAKVSITAGSGAGHGLKANEYVQISDGTLDITTKAAMKKGITSDGYVLVEGGVTTINVSGGVAYDSDDGEYTGSAGIKADNYFGMTGGTVTITNSGSGGKGIRAESYDFYAANSNSLNDSYISGGNLTITTSGSESNDVSAKAIKIGFKEKISNSYKYGGNLLVKGGTTIVNCSKSEAVEVKGKLTISAGEFYVSSTGDDAINSQGELNITGGYVYGYSTQNDAIDTNCDFKISGGYVYAITTKGAPEVALDANTEGGYKLYITGGTVVAYGGLESGYSSSNAVYTLSGTANAWNALYSGSSFIAAFKAPSSLSSFAVCAPSLKSGYKGVSVNGTTYCNGVWAASGISGGTSVTLSAYSGGSQGGGPGGGGGGRPGGH